MAKSDKKVQRITDNPELVAINKVQRLLSGVDIAVRSRVLRFVVEAQQREEEAHWRAEYEKQQSVARQQGNVLRSTDACSVGPMTAGPVGAASAILGN